jgi:hypothetical protein
LKNAWNSSGGNGDASKHEAGNVSPSAVELLPNEHSAINRKKQKKNLGAYHRSGSHTERTPATRTALSARDGAGAPRHGMVRLTASLTAASRKNRPGEKIVETFS